jgi:hypothetical protein
MIKDETKKPHNEVRLLLRRIWYFSLSGTEGTRTLDLRLDRTERFMSTNGGSDSVFER